jgi:nitrite reductase (NADH) large subunit
VPAVVIGGGLLGHRGGLRPGALGVPVTLLHLMDRLMERQLDAEGRAASREASEAAGIRVLLQAQTRAIHCGSVAESVELQDGRRHRLRAVVMAVGVRANTELAETGGCRRGAARCRRPAADRGARHPCHRRLHRACGACYGLVEPAYEHARIVARVLCGEAASYPGSMLATNLKVSGVPVFSAGDFEGVGRRAHRRAR